MLTGKRTPITSRMDFHYDFLLKTLQNQGLDWTSLLNHSYWKIQREHDLQAIQTEMGGLQAKMTALNLSQDILYECLERFDLEYKVKGAVNAEKRKAQAALETWKNKHMGPAWDAHWKSYQIWLDLDKQWGQCRDRYEALEYPQKEVEQKIAFLQEAGYLKEDRMPTLRGTLATEVNEGHSLLLSFAYANGLCHSFTSEELVCFLAGFLGSDAEKSLEQPSLESLSISVTVCEALYSVDDYARDLMAIERRHRIISKEGYWDLNSACIELCKRWFQGEDAASLCEEYGIYMGNFMRCMLKLGNLIEEWINMATYCKHTELLERYKDLKETIVRGIAKPQSLYLLL